MAHCNDLSKLSSIIILLVFIIFSFTCCNPRIITLERQGVNSDYNEQYRESKKSFTGQINQNDYIAVMAAIQDELGVSIPSEKAVLINYEQAAPNCIDMSIAIDKNGGFNNRTISISDEVTSENNAVYFLVYAEDTFFKDYYKNSDTYHLDSGFFRNNIFTLQENCGAFIILKPDGQFLKYYGEDYFNTVKAFLSE